MSLIKRLTLILLSIFCLCHAAQGQESERYRILVLNSYHKGYTWTDNIVKGLESALKPTVNGFDFIVEYMDSKAIVYDVAYKKNLYDMYAYKYANQTFDVIISTDDNALNFLREYHGELFPHVPIVFCGVNNTKVPKLVDRNIFTGILEIWAAKENVKLILALHPQTRQIVVINGNTPSAEYQWRKLESIFNEFDNIDFERLDSDFSMVEIKDYLRRLPEESVVMYSSMQRDKTGTYYSHKDALEHISKVSSRPIYGLHAQALTHGIVGGKLLAGYYEGQETGRMTFMLLAGQKPSEIPIIERDNNQYMFDYQELKRWHIDFSDLPKGSIIANEPESILRNHTLIVMLSLLVLIILFVLIILLTFNIRRRKQSERSLKKSRDGLEIEVINRTSALRKVNENLIVEIAERKQTETELKKTTHDLGERMKELKCLYGISELFVSKDIDLNSILQGTVELIPPSWQYPEITCARIILHDQKYQTDNFKETLWKQSGDIFVKGERAGTVDIYSLEEIKDAFEGPFIKEEKDLLQAICLRLGSIIDFDLTQKELQTARSTADLANRSKSDFLASMSHELRTPLNAVLGFAQVLSKDKNIPARHGDHVAMIRQSGEILLALINQVLDLSKIESGQMSVVETRFDLYSILDEINQMFSLFSKQKRLTLSIECGEDIPRNIVTDELKLRQVLINLISNALKFTEKGNVSLVVKSPEKSIDSRSPSPSSPSPGRPVMLQFTIKDTGPGIAPEEIDLLFSPFTQAEEGKKSLQGTGLGLSISQKFVELLGGEITVKSQLKKGTTFSFTIPVGKTSHSDENQTRTSIIISNAGPDISQDTLKTEFKSLSRPLILKLEEAATYCEIDDIHQIIQQVENLHPNLAGELERLVKEFDFDGILTLIKEIK